MPVVTKKPTVTLHLGNCKDFMPAVHAVVTDPPYGCDNDCDYTRFSGGMHDSRNFHKGIRGDNKPFDPTPFLRRDKVIIWGYQFFKPKPDGTILVWLKRRPNQLGRGMLSDCELAWQKGGKGCYLFRHVWNGFDRDSEKGLTLHPSQKPVALMRWCIQRLKLPAGATVYDPYMGSGSTAVAAISLGYNFAGCEIEEEYYKTVIGRLAGCDIRLKEE